MSSFDEMLNKEKKETTQNVSEFIPDEEKGTVIPSDKEIEDFFKKKESEDVEKKNEDSGQELKTKRETEKWTDEDRDTVKEGFIKKIRASRKERKRIRSGEKSSVFDIQRFLVGIFAVSIFFLVMLWTYSPADETLMTIILLIGIFVFMPIGAVVGWMVLDPFMRCKILRKMTRQRRNYGIVNFVGKGKKIVSRIKNFDEDLIWIKNKCWALTKEGIYELDKQGDRVVDKTFALDPDSFVTITESVPVMFIDINSMQPLTFKETGREGIAPEELGSTLKGWVDNQMAKVMFLKRTMDAYFLIVILSAMVGAYFGYQNNLEIMELKDEFLALKKLITNNLIMIFPWI